MPKAHFDEGELCRAALDTPHGITVSTNHPAGFRRLMYKHMGKHPDDRVQILQNPDVASGVMLVPPSAYEEAMNDAATEE